MSPPVKPELSPRAQKFIERAKGHGYSDVEIQRYLADHPDKFTTPKASDLTSDIKAKVGHALGVDAPIEERLAAGLQAAGLNLPGLLLGKKFRDLATKGAQDAPLAPIIGGALTGGLSAGLARKVPLPLLMGGEGAIAGAAGNPDHPVVGGVTGGLLGAGAGAIPSVAEGLLGAVGKGWRALNPSMEGVAKDIARPLHRAEVPLNTMSDNPPTIPAGEALKRVARDMPGANIPAALTPEVTKSVAAISSNPPAAAASIDHALTGMQAVGAKQQALQAEYQAIQNGPKGVVEVTPELRGILNRLGTTDGINPVVAFTRLQELRQDIGAKLARDNSPQVQRIVGPALDDLRSFMDQHFTASPAGEPFGALPPAPPGTVRLYRANGPSRPAVSDAIALDPTTSAGRSFSSDPGYVTDYATNLRAPTYHYVDVPSAVADASAYRHGAPGEHRLPREWADRAVVAPPSGGHRALKDIDADWAFSNVWKDRLQNYLDMLRGTTASQARQGVAGSQVLSAGGQLSMGRPGISTFLRSLNPGAGKQGLLAAQLMAQPTDQIPAPVQAAGRKLASDAAGALKGPIAPLLPRVLGGLLLGPVEQQLDQQRGLLQ